MTIGSWTELCVEGFDGGGGFLEVDAKLSEEMEWMLGDDLPLFEEVAMGEVRVINMGAGLDEESSDTGGPSEDANCVIARPQSQLYDM